MDMIIEYESHRRKVFLDESWNWDASKMAEYQSIMLSKLIDHCSRNVPYYKNMFNEYGISPGSIKDTEDLKKLPLTDKQTVVLNRSEFIAENIPEYMTRLTCTGGTMSAPLHFPKHLSAIAWEKAFYRRMWGWHGYEREKCLIMRGNHGMNKKLFSYNPVTKYITVNIKGLSDDIFSKITDIMLKTEPRYIQAYPSIAWLYALFINKYSLSNRINFINKIFTGSEKLYNFQVREIKKAFGCDVIDAYGQNEMISLMQKDAKNDVYYPIPEYGITEFIYAGNDNIGNVNACNYNACNYNTGNVNIDNDNAGNVNISNDNIDNVNTAEIVGTGFLNPAFPLIRYKTGDIASLSFAGKTQRITEIYGRTGDFVKTATGRLYSPTILEFAVDNVSNIKDLQLIQTGIDRLDILFVPDNNSAYEDALKVKYELLRIMNNEININLHIVEEIKRPASLKKRFVISKCIAAEQEEKRDAIKAENWIFT